MDTTWLEYANDHEADLPDDLRRMLSNEHFSSVIRECWDIYDRKGKDYTQGKGDLDRLDNFKQAAARNGVTPYQAIGVYFFKHEAAMWRFLKEGRVESEPIEGRLYDIINYTILLLLMISADKAGEL